MKPLIILMPVLMLTACTTYQEGFDCAAVPGVGCKSITQVDRLIDQGKLGNEEESLEEKVSQPETSQKREPFDPSLKRQGVQVWLAPYEDDNGTWHDSQMLFVPLKKS
jgi:conjugal transfer pilus assembly protein TraV